MSKRNPNKATWGETPKNGLRLEWWDADQLQANPQNWRRHPKAQADALKGVLAEVGWAGALLYNEGTGRLVDGHLRKDVAKGQKVPVLVGNWTESQEREILATLDPIGAMAQPDMDALVKLLAEVQSAKPAINALLEALANGESLPLRPGLTADDEIPEQVEAICKTGDLWQLGEHRLLCGDATKKEDVERLMGREKADMVFTDPPYAVNYGHDQLQLQRKSGGYSKTRKASLIRGDNLGVQDCAEFIWGPAFGNLYELAKDDCSFYLTMYQGGDQMMMMMMMMMQQKWQIKHELIWVKSSAVFSMGRLDYDNQHEPILFGWKRKHNFYGRGQFTKSVWEIPKPNRNDLYPTMKPIALIENCLANSSKLSDVILDTFGGSGSTLIACEKLGRRCFMMEIDEHYCDVIIQRWQNFTGQQAVRL